MSDEAAVADAGTSEAQDAGFDIEAQSDSLALEMFPVREDSANTEEGDGQDMQSDDTGEQSQQESEEPAQQKPQQQEATPAPKTWPKEMHEHWAKTPKEVQDYWNTREKQMLDGLEQYKGDAGYGRQMKEAITPYMALIQAQGIDAPQAVQTLLNAHYKLSVSNPTQKAEYFQSLARQYGVDLGGIQPQEGQPQIDPMVRQLQDELHNIKQVIQSGNQQQLDAERNKIQNEVNAFASDPSHPYFEEVSEDIITMLKSGATLQDAYDKAVWANPVTRQKEISRIQTEQQEALKQKAIAEVEAKKKAASITIRNRDSQRTPTGPRATMNGLDAALRETMREINSRH